MAEAGRGGEPRGSVRATSPGFILFCQSQSAARRDTSQWYPLYTHHPDLLRCTSAAVGRSRSRPLSLVLLPFACDRYSKSVCERGPAAAGGKPDAAVRFRRDTTRSTALVTPVIGAHRQPADARGLWTSRVNTRRCERIRVDVRATWIDELCHDIPRRERSSRGSKGEIAREIRVITVFRIAR